MASSTCVEGENREVSRILIVDDDGFTRMLLKGALEGGGYRVSEAPDGQQALVWLQANREGVDLLVTDLNMPGMTGTRLVQTLRGEGCALPIIVLSGNDDVSAAIGVIHDGADDYLLKDENIEETVLFAVQKLLDKVRIERENRLLLDALRRSNQDLAAEVVRRQHHEAQIRRDYESRTAINRLLESAMTGLALVQQLETMLDIILAVPWFELQKRGVFFLVDERSGDLLLRASRGLTREQEVRCARLSAAQSHHSACLRAVEEGTILFIPHEAFSQESYCSGITECSRYVVPIYLQHRAIGVMKLYLAAGHQPVPEEESFLHAVASTLANLLERQRLEEAIKQKAEYDPLTGFANRALFYDRLTQAITTAQRTDKDLVLMFIDLDRFKQVNDTLGHEAGDRLLQDASRRIAGCLRSTDLLARLGGDEFTVILPWLTHAFYIEYVARRILEELNKPFFLPQGEASISGSLGITFFPNDASDMEQLIKNADAAMYQAKTAGRSTFRFFTPAMNEAADERVMMEKALVQAWDNREFVLYYQPRVRAETGGVQSVEVQLRWNRPGEGGILPERFMACLEQTDLLVPLGLWMLETACRQYQAWQQAGHLLTALILPLSIRQLQQGTTLVEMVRAVLAETRLPPACLEWELNGASLLPHWEKTLPLLKALQGTGVGLAVRDVGVLPFSPADLQTVGIRSIKIDSRLQENLPANEARATLLRGVAALAMAFSWEVVAEGVETGEQAAFLKASGCHLLQGRCFGPPMEAEALTRLLDQGG
ncbi:MAG: EAL domain-containing protein [Magnetococcus sp. MYC-9]